jgi:hypothetical protein
MEENQDKSPSHNLKPLTSEESSASSEPLPYPLDFVVHHINQAVQHQQSDDSEDEAVLEVNYELKKEGFKITNKDYGADFEFSEADGNESPKPTSSTAAAPKLTGSAKFRKGHRRAWSMPNAKDKAVLVVAEDSINDDGQQKRHVVRYRLHPYRLDDEKTNDAVNLFIQASNFDIEFPLDDEDIEFDDEGFCFPGAGPSTKGTRGVMKRVCLLFIRYCSLTVNLRFGKLHGKHKILIYFQLGFKTMNICEQDIDHLFQVLQAAFKVFLSCILKQEIFGLIYMVVWHSLD